MSSLYQKNGIWHVATMIDTPTGRRQVCRSLKTRNYRSAVRVSKSVIQELTTISLSQLLNQWVIRKIQNHNSRRYIDDAEGSMKDLIEYFGNVGASSITTQKLRDFKSYLITVRKLNPTTVALRLRTLKAVFSFGYKNDLIPKHPFKGLELPRTNKKIEFLSKDEIKKLLELSSRNKLHNLFLQFLLATGCRRGELANLRWSDINEHILTFNGKTGLRSFPVNPQIKEILDEIKSLQKRECEFVLSSEYGHHIKGQNLSGLVKNYLRKIKSSYSCHTLRHTFVSWLIMQGKPIFLVQRLAGHKSIQTTMLYSHLTPEFLQVDTKYF